MLVGDIYKFASECETEIPEREFTAESECMLCIAVNPVDRDILRETVTLSYPDDGIAHSDPGGFDGGPHVSAMTRSVGQLMLIAFRCWIGDINGPLEGVGCREG